MAFNIAEIGINHNGDIKIAKELIDQAKFCGCDAVKFQKRTIDLVYTKEFLDSERDSPWGTTQREQKEGIELTYSQYVELKSYCDRKAIHLMASAWDLESQSFLDSLGVSYNKIASPMLTNLELLDLVSFNGKHTFISTGMSTKDEIDTAVGIFIGNKCSFELMHCVSVYPMPVHKANLKRIITLRDIYRCNVGYSGHEVGISVSLAACALGATSLERHVTLDRSMYGSDQSASLEINGLRNLIKSVHEIELSIGDGSMQFKEDELTSKNKLR